MIFHCMSIFLFAQFRVVDRSDRPKNTTDRKSDFRSVIEATEDRSIVFGRNFRSIRPDREPTLHKFKVNINQITYILNP